jgi:hypothetical protein
VPSTWRRWIVSTLGAATVVAPSFLGACAGMSGNDDDDGGACAVGSFVVTSVAFEESGCLIDAARDGTTVSASAPGLRWVIDAFDDDALSSGSLDDTNSRADGRYEREGQIWRALTGAIGGVPIGESAAVIEDVSAAAWRGRVDGVLHPSDDNDNVDSVFVSIVTDG